VLASLLPLACTARPHDDAPSVRVDTPSASIQRVVGEVPPAPRAAPEQPASEPPANALPTVPMNVPALAQAVMPAVVNITTTEKSAEDTVGSSGELDPFEFFFGRPGEEEHRRPAEKRVGLGSGFIIDPAGYVVTNEHVVHDAVDVRVRLADEREFDAKVVGRDPVLDVALLRIQGAHDLPAAKLGSSAALRVGEPVMAVGNPYGLGHTVTTGIVSAKERTLGLGPYDDFIQTDASINPGNSGGPLFDSRGQVVGMNTAIRAGATGIGFAMPVDAIKEVLPQLRSTGHVERGKLGLAFQSVTSDLARALGLDAPHGALVAEVEPGGPAAKAGLAPGDVVVAVDGTKVHHATDLPREIAQHAPGSEVRLTVLRKGKTLELRPTLGELTPPSDGSTDKPKPEAPSGSESRFGLRVSNAPGRSGVRVDGVESDDIGDVQPGDVILEVAGSAIHDVGDLKAALSRAKPGSTVLVRIHRGDATRFSALRIPSGGK
jgi:serine protease Do